MQMVRHQQIITHQPRLCGLPRSAEMIVNHVVGQPGFPVFRASREENDRRLARVDMNAAGWMFASDVVMWRVVGHVKKMPGKFHVVNGGVRLRRTLTDFRHPGYGFSQGSTELSHPTTVC